MNCLQKRRRKEERKEGVGEWRSRRKGSVKERGQRYLPWQMGGTFTGMWFTLNYFYEYLI